MSDVTRRRVASEAVPVGSESGQCASERGHGRLQREGDGEQEEAAPVVPSLQHKSYVARRHADVRYVRRRLVFIFCVVPAAVLGRTSPFASELCCANHSLHLQRRADRIGDCVGPSRSRSALALARGAGGVEGRARTCGVHIARGPLACVEGHPHLVIHRGHLRPFGIGLRHPLLNAVHGENGHARARRVRLATVCQSERVGTRRRRGSAPERGEGTDHIG